MRDVTAYPLSPNQRKEVEEYMNNHNVTENEARCMLGYVSDSQQVSVIEALEMVKRTKLIDGIKLYLVVD